MALNISDMRIQHTVEQALFILEKDPTLDEVILTWDVMTQYKDHFENWYGQGSAEHNLICALVTLQGMIKTFIQTCCSKDDGGKEGGNLPFSRWLNNAPLRNALRIRLHQCTHSPHTLTGA